MYSMTRNSCHSNAWRLRVTRRRCRRGGWQIRNTESTFTLLTWSAVSIEWLSLFLDWFRSYTNKTRFTLKKKWRYSYRSIALTTDQRITRPCWLSFVHVAYSEPALSPLPCEETDVGTWSVGERCLGYCLRQLIIWDGSWSVERNYAQISSER